MARPTCRCRLDAVETKLDEIERVNERIDYTNRVFIFDPVIQVLRQQGRLPTIRAFHKSTHEQSDGVIDAALVAFGSPYYSR